MDAINKYIDHTNLKPFATKEDIAKLCEEAEKHQFASVCVNPYYVKLASELLKDSSTKVCTVIGFPLGQNTTEIKVNETKKALEDGCDEFDMVINVGALKDNKLDFVLEEIKQVVLAANGKTVKVIIETGLLTKEEIITATCLTCKAGAHFVKTCTGVSKGIATVEDVKLMKEHISGNTQIKASAGIKDKETAISLINAGASRIGTSSGVEIIK